MPREILRITPETTYGVYASGNPHTIVDLNADDAFTMRAAPNFWEIASAGSDNLIVKTGTATTDIDGTLQMLGRPSQSALLASMIAGITGTNCKKLPSSTIDHGIFIEDGGCTPVLRRYLGVIADGSFSLTNQTNGVLMLWNLKLMAATVADIMLTDFPVPLFSAYDYAENPFQFQQATGAILYDSVDISPYVESLSFSSGNILTAFRGGQKYRTRIGYFGRRPTMTMGMLYYSTQFRVNFEANTPKPLNVTFTDADGNTLELEFGNTNFIRAVGDNLHLGDFHRESITFMNTLDPATGTDMSITYTAAP